MRMMKMMVKTRTVVLLLIASCISLTTFAQNLELEPLSITTDDIYPKRTLNDWHEIMTNVSYIPNPNEKLTSGNSQPKNAGKEIIDVGIKSSHSMISPRIVGGEESRSRQFPWQASINIDNRYLCGGSLISSEWILTSAKCILGGKRLLVRIGSQFPFRGGQSQIASQSIIHTKFSSNPIQNDIGLIRVNFTLNQQVNPIRLPGPNFQNLLGKTARASGWGQTTNSTTVSSVLQWVDLIIIDNLECLAVFGYFTKDQLCVSGINSRSICNSDTGGPLSIQDKYGYWYQVGIASYGSKYGCMANYPTAFTRVNAYRNWISANTGISF